MNAQGFEAVDDVAENLRDTFLGDAYRGSGTYRLSPLGLALLALLPTIRVGDTDTKSKTPAEERGVTKLILCAVTLCFGWAYKELM